MTSDELGRLREAANMARRLAQIDLPMELLRVCNALELEQRTRRAEWVERQTLLSGIYDDLQKLGQVSTQDEARPICLRLVERVMSKLGDPPPT
jgi:hypothetical protein